MFSTLLHCYLQHTNEIHHARDWACSLQPRVVFYSDLGAITVLGPPSSASSPPGNVRGVDGLSG